MKPRFSLRTLLLVMTLIAALFGWRGYNHQRAAKVAELISAGNDAAAAEYGADPDEFAIYLKQIRGDGRSINATVTILDRWQDWWLPSIFMVITKPDEKTKVSTNTYQRGNLGVSASVGPHGLKVTVAITQSIRGF